MRLLIGTTILVAVALALTSKRAYGLRRTRIGTVLTTGGWVLVAVGMIFGPDGAHLLDRQQVLTLHPLILFCLGLVGLMVGLQMDRRLPAALPAVVPRAVLVDALASFLVVWLLAWAVMHAVGHPRLVIGPVAILLAVCSVGWSAEVRSLRRPGLASQAMTSVMRAASGLAAVLAVMLYGMLIKSMVLDAASGTVVELSAGRMVIALGISVLIALAMGFTGQVLLGVIGRRGAEFLLVMIGLVSLTAGTASTLGFSPVTVCMLLGCVLANLRGKTLDKLKRVVIEAEQPVAMVLMLVAGLLAEPGIGVVGWLMVGAVLIGRGVVKLGLMRWRLRRETQIEGTGAELSGLMRQGPLAIALAVSYALSPYGRAHTPSLDGAQVLTVVIIVGLLSEVWPLVYRHARPSTATGGVVTVERRA